MSSSVWVKKVKKVKLYENINLSDNNNFRAGVCLDECSLVHCDSE